jgi:hypothetical protein
MSFLEIIWQQDATASVFTRGVDDERSALRTIDVRELIALAGAPPEEPELGDTARALFAVIELARSAVAEGLVHPDLHYGDGWWFAFWGATLDERVQETLTEIAAALPEVSAGAFLGDRDATVHDL